MRAAAHPPLTQEPSCPPIPLCAPSCITAVFVDFENLALGVEQDKKGRFEIELVLKRLLERGRIVFKRAYCDWTRFQNFMQRIPSARLRDGRHPAARRSPARTAPTSAWSSTRSTSATRNRTSTRSCWSPATATSRRSSRSSRRTTSASSAAACAARRRICSANNCDEFIFYDDLIRVQKRTQTRRRRAGAKSDHRGRDRDRQRARRDRHRQAQARGVRPARRDRDLARDGLRPGLGLAGEADGEARLSRDSTRATTATGRSPSCSRTRRRKA